MLNGEPQAQACILTASVPSSPPHHRFRVTGTQGQLTFRAEATLTAPWTLLFGPSGSGKSTLLRAIAGLVPALDTTFDRYESPSDTWHSLAATPTHRRQLAYDPQGGILLPHLTVMQNLRFPESLRTTQRAGFLLPELIDLFELTTLLSKRPQQLSGGERQRISLARALAVPDAHLLLLDEPFAGLDRSRRDALLPRLQAHLATRRLPVLSVTHDPDEALLLQAEVLRLHEGTLGPPAPAAEALADEVQRLRKVLGL